MEKQMDRGAMLSRDRILLSENKDFLQKILLSPHSFHLSQAKAPKLNHDLYGARRTGEVFIKNQINMMLIFMRLRILDHFRIHCILYEPSDFSIYLCYLLLKKRIRLSLYDYTKRPNEMDC